MSVFKKFFPLYNLEHLYTLVKASSPSELQSETIQITEIALGDYFVLYLRDRTVLAMYNAEALQLPKCCLGPFGNIRPYHLYLSYATRGRNRCYGMAFPETLKCSMITSSSMDALVRKHLTRIRIRAHILKLIKHHADHIDHLLWRPETGLMTRFYYQQSMRLIASQNETNSINKVTH